MASISLLNPKLTPLNLRCSTGSKIKIKIKASSILFSTRKFPFPFDCAFWVSPTLQKIPMSAESSPLLP